MYASSSRTIIKSSFKATSRSFATTAPSAARRETFVELLQDVPGLGRTFDRLFVAPGRARNDLVPTRKARFVPFKDNSQRQIYRATEADRSSPNHPLIESPNSSSVYEQRTNFSTPSSLETPQELLNSLHLIPESLVFKRRTISKDYPSLHGSLTLSEITEKLELEFGIQSKEFDLHWLNLNDQQNLESSSRIKELGKYSLMVQLKKYGKESTVVEVEVERLGEGESEN